MSNKQTIINIIDTVPQSVIDEIYHYALYLKQQFEKETRNAAYVEKILEGKKQCAEGRGIRRDIIEVSEYE
jgi:hypothetical protein